VKSKRAKIETANLERGMYVAQLDRPWLETPFLFQGFEIREDSELKQLRQFCQHVYVDPTRGSLPRDRLARALAVRDHESQVAAKATRAARAPRAKPLGFAARIMRAVTQLDPTGQVAARFSGHRAYRNSVPTRREAPAAIRAYDTALAIMTQMLAEIRAGAGIDVVQLEQAARPLVDSILRNQDAMAWLVVLRKREEYPNHHSIASAVWAAILGRHLGFDRANLDTLALGGLLLDVGKARVPETLTGREGRLNDNEFATMMSHVRLGMDLVKLMPGINADVLTMVAGHHERADGSGYPGGLKGADIPVFARIAGLVDCYDAMTSRRPWAPPKSPYDAIRELNSLAGTLFQREMVEQFVQAVGMFPPGSVVEMQSGEVGIVIEQNAVRRLRPTVLLVLDAAHQPLPEVRTLDLARCPSDELSDGAAWIERGHHAGAFGVDPQDWFIAQDS
jgi:HD-GYP domain-containing protein (c-di-GMP phosphodiesterase class II)